MSCVVINSEQFKKKVAELDIAADDLENIAHYYLNEKGRFPTDEEILSEINPAPFNASEDETRLWYRLQEEGKIDFKTNNANEAKTLSQYLDRTLGAEHYKFYKDAQGLYRVKVATPMQETPFSLTNLDYSKVSIRVADKTWRDDKSKSNKALRIFLKDSMDKGYFELVKDEEDNNYSIHFKTNNGTYGDAVTATTKEERALLYDQIIKAIPEGATVSTWGSISKGGIIGLNKIGKDMVKVGERDATSKETGETIKIPIFKNERGINIFYSTNENAGLSNLAERPFTVEKSNGSTHYQRVEQALQTAKMNSLKAFLQRELSTRGETVLPNKYLRKGAIEAIAKINIILSSLQKSSSGYEDRELGKTKVTDRLHETLEDIIQKEFFDKEWAANKEKYMKFMLKESFSQNESALRSLLETGDVTLTHKQGGEWAEAFPRLLMEVRGELKKENPELAKEVIAAKQKTLKEKEKALEKVATKVGKDAVQTTLKTLNSDNSELSASERVSIKSIMGDKKPRVLIASETTDPVFHAAKIKKMVEAELAKPRGQRNFQMLYLITKHDGLPLKELAKLPIPKFYHFSITTLGGTQYEPGVMKTDDLLDRIEEFIKDGTLKPNLITIRIDPCIPGVTKEEDIRHVVERASTMGIRQFKFSVMDSYGYTESGEQSTNSRDRFIIQRMSELGYDWDTYYGRDENGKVMFNAKQSEVERIYRFMDDLAVEFKVWFNTCGEQPKGITGLKRIKTNMGCVNVESMNEVMGTNDIAHVEGHQRAECSCYGLKSDALRYNDSCASSCVYCYAHHNSDKALQYYNPDGTLKDMPLTRTSEPTTTTKPPTLSEADIQAEVDKYNGKTGTSEITPNTTLNNFVLHSGGAVGSDSYWGEIGEKYGVKINHYYGEDMKTPKGNVSVSKEELAEADEHLKKANKTLKRSFPTKNDYVNNLLRRDWSQVKHADAVFAIGTITNGLVDGGTGWAVQMAIDNGKPVYVFDQNKEQWFKYENGNWEEWVVPYLTENFAGIGTRGINEAGKKAIEQAYAAISKNIIDFEDAVMSVALDHFTQSEEFKEKFGDWEHPNKDTSKAVDEDGKPLLMWHTSPTSNRFESFDTSDRRIMKKQDGTYDRAGMAFIHNLSEEQIDDLIEKDKQGVSSTAIYASSSREVSNSYSESMLEAFEREESRLVNNADHYSEENSLIREGLIDNLFTAIFHVENFSKQSIDPEKYKKIKEFIKDHPLENFNVLDINDSNFNKEIYDSYIKDYLNYVMPSYASLENPVDVNEGNYNDITGHDRPLYLIIKNPLIVDANGSNWNNISFEGNTESTRSLEKIAKDRGHDGIIVKNVIDLGGHGTVNNETSTVMAVWENSQVIDVDKALDNNTEGSNTTNNTTQTTKPIQQLVITNSSSQTAAKAKEIGGIDTLRHPDANGMHFGNPFSYTNYKGTTNVGTVKEAVIAFEQWLRGEKYQDVEPERRQWIVDQINNGSLVGKPLVYYTDKIPDNSYGRTTYDYNEAPSHAHILQKLINEKATLPTKEKQEPSLQVGKKQQIKQENQSFMEKSVKINEQLDNLNNSSLLSATEVTHIAEQAVFWISDHISEIQDNPDLAVKIYGEHLKDKDFAHMDRIDVVNTIGADNIVAMCKAKFSPENADYDSFETMDKAELITDNWDAVMMLASNLFDEIEDFSIVSANDGKTSEAKARSTEEGDNYDASNGEYDIKENEGSLQEHWQVESRTLDIVETMGKLVKRAFLKCYLLDSDGNNITSEFGINERVTLREAAQSVLRWTQGALTLEKVISRLENKVESHPWVQQLIDRLSKTDGSETDLQGQFMGFCKPFQSYSVVIEENGTYKSIQVNENPALTEAMETVVTQYKIGEHPLFTSEGVNEQALTELNNAYAELEKFRGHTGYDLKETKNKKEAARILGYISNILGYYVTPDMVEENLDYENFASMYESLKYITKALNDHKDTKTYEPFKFDAEGSIRGNVSRFLKPITDSLEDTAVSAFYDSGKMYQSYVTPSYTTKLFQKFQFEGEEFDKFIMDEYGNFPWFHTGDDIETGWRVGWLKTLVNDKNAKKIFKHKVQLNFNKHNYMRNMDDMEYTLSLFTEYFSETASDKQSRVPAWFRVPMLSNKPSSEFIRFYSERGSNYRDVLTDGFKSIFDQELSRIQTVIMRNKNKKDEDFIKNFDTNGKKFMFLEFMNDYLEGKKKTVTIDNDEIDVNKLLQVKIKGERKLESKEEADLNRAVKQIIKTSMEARAQSIVNAWMDQGIIEGAKKIANIGISENEIRENLINFVWNDAYAAMNIMELTITDIAYYKDAEDLQKRLAQIHAPGIRGNINATDYEGNPVTDGKFRSVKLADFDTFISNVIDNVAEVFNRKIEAAPEAEKAALRALRDSLIAEEIRDANGEIIQQAGSFRQINVADAQGYSSITSYRKKALIFGKWSKEAEEVYKKLKEGTYTYKDLSIAFQPLKPFVYSQMIKEANATGVPLDKLKVPIQYKNSEYLLIMADALLQGSDTGKPNLLRAITEVMEESHFDENGNYRTDGIDTIQFESTTKSGLMGKITLNDLINDPHGEAIAKERLRSAIYATKEQKVQETNPETGETVENTVNVQTGEYNNNRVDTINFEDYCLQQEVPEHFKEHSQAHGSQLRYIIPSELEAGTTEAPITYSLEGRQVTAQEFKEEYESTIAENIEESINELAEELSIGQDLSLKDRNIALSKLLQREILTSISRYGVDLLQACSVDENGRFRIPLGDSIQSKRVEQLINSIIKNRVNKQTIAGGPVVQVSNFGTSKELNIRFKNKNGGELLTRAEWDKLATKPTEETTYNEYIRKNQGGIAYFEVFAPIYTNQLFTQFADKNGVINIKALEMIDPDLLKMIGYRI
jgi:hypothetical protein